MSIRNVNSPMDWPSRTQADLENFKKIIIQNHPAVIVPKDEFPSFHDWLEKGFLEASKMAKSAQSIEAYISCMHFFAAGFHDGHLRFGAKPLPDYTWPGFLLSWQNGKVVVSNPDQSNKELPAESSEVTLINNEKATSFIERYLFPHLREDSQIERKWIKATAISLVDSERFGQPEISEITYKSSDGINHIYPLQKNKIKHKELINKLEKACLEDDHEFRIEPFSDHGI